MKKMKVGDQVFFYHSRQGLEIVGIMEVSEEQFPDPFDDTGRWIAVKVKPVRKLDKAVPLKEMKQNPKLGQSGDYSSDPAVGRAGNCEMNGKPFWQMAGPELHSDRGSHRVTPLKVSKLFL